VSEYQYYEFLALDNPLTEDQLTQLRSLSSRAEITTTRFTNEYHYGDFRGNPATMMERYFDAFLYYANFGTRRLMFRLPLDVLGVAVAEQYCHTDAASIIKTDEHVIVSLFTDHDPDDYWDEAPGKLAAMVGARSNLAAGDLRLLYLGWLLAIQSGDEDEVDEDDTEPPVPAGLGNLSASLRAVADFLEIDEDLLAAAAQASPDLAEYQEDGLREWISALPAEGSTELLARVAAGAGTMVQAELLRRFRKSTVRPTDATTPSRTVAELWKAVDGRRADRERAKAEREREEAERRRAEQIRRAAQQKAAYAKRLDDLAPQLEAAWERVAALIETRSGATTTTP
jgi:hypothetical protein